MDQFDLVAYCSAALVVVGGVAVFFYARWRSLRQQDLMLALSFVVFLSGWVMRFPVQPDVSGAERVILAMVDALRYFTMEVTYEPLEGMTNLWYRYVDVVLRGVAPICTTMILLSLLQMVGWVRFRLFFWRPVYCFSELNERSFAMAKSVMDDWKSRKGEFFKPVLVFFKTEPHDDSVELQYRAEAQRLGATFYRDPIHAVRLPDPWLRRVKVFLIDEDEDSNMGTATRMKDWICPDRKRRFPGHYTDSDLLVFSTRESSEVVFDKLLGEMKAKRERILGADRAKKEDARLDMHLVNETKLIAQKLLWEHPLYEALEGPGGGDISMLLVGGGRLGMEILRAAMVCGVMDTCKFRATVVDQNGNQLGSQFRHEYSLLPDCVRDAVTFRQADVTTAELDNVLDSPGTDPNYIVVATGDDERNVTTAQFLQRWYARKKILAGEILRKPQRIYVAIRDQGRYESLAALQNDGLVLFGCHSEIFRTSELLERPIDRVAMLFHSAYNARGKKLNPSVMLPREQSWLQRQFSRLLNLWDPDKRKAKHRYFSLSAVDLHSNQLVVMHSIYKFRDMLLRSGTVEAYEKASTREAFALLVHLMSDNRQALYELEHRRWEVFQTLDGWQPFPLKRIVQYGTVQREQEEKLQGLNMHKHMIARLHGCLTPYDRLTPLADTLNELYQPEENKEFLEYDRVMCVNSLVAWLDLVADPEEAVPLRKMVRGILEMSLDRDGRTSADRTLNYLEIQIPKPQILQNKPTE